MNATDWPALLPDVARRLLGEPLRTEAGGTWRYGTHGSMAVHVGGARAGTWHDFEADAGGGTLALIEHLAQTDRAGALAWLVDHRLIAPRSGAPTRPHHAPAPRGAQVPSRRLEVEANRPESPTSTVAAVILSRSVPADATPARAYLAARGTWPPFGTGPNLPPSVRWLPPEAWPDLPGWPGRNGLDRRLHPPADGVRSQRSGAPPTLCGAVVFALARPGYEPDAVTLEAVTAAGRRPAERWRRTCGPKTARVFTARDVPGGALVLAEGECSALALAVTAAGGCVRAAGGTSGFRPDAVELAEDRPVVIVPDADNAGAVAVLDLVANHGARVRPWPAILTGDPADWLFGEVSERAGIREHDGGLTRSEADRAAWRDLLAAVERGWRLVEVA
ncbi:MAG: toprim domain-containing protein [Spirochaetaceae bacterium]|nr:toprim domain-containing protein [Spirochaetaceae bacterium]